MVHPVISAIPNTLSLTRLLLGIVFFWLPAEGRWVAIALAAITDFADGYLSRKLHIESDLGRTLDPIADKGFFLGVGITWLVENTVAGWEAVLFFVRDGLVLVGSLVVGLVAGWKSIHQLRPRLMGKVTTAFQLIWATVILLGWTSWRTPLLAMVGFTGLLAAVDYWRAYASSIHPKR